MDGARFSTFTKWAMAYVVSIADATVSLSKMEGKRQSDVYSVRGAMHETIPNGINTDEYSYRRENTAGKNQPWQLLFSGQLIPMKRCDVLLRAFAKVRHDARLTMVYQNPALETELKSLAATLGVAERVRFAGKVQPRELAALYRASDVLVLPSRTEALPSVITEAMLCGLHSSPVPWAEFRSRRPALATCWRPAQWTMFAASIDRVLDQYSQYDAASPR